MARRKNFNIPKPGSAAWRKAIIKAAVHSENFKLNPAKADEKKDKKLSNNLKDAKQFLLSFEV